MTYFKHSSWKISTWLPAGCEQQGRLRELRRAVPNPKPVRGVQGPGWLRLPRVANPGGCFKPAAVPLAPAQPPPRWLTAPKALTPFPRLVIPRISLSLPNCLSGQHGSQHTSAEARRRVCVARAAVPCCASEGARSTGGAQGMLPTAAFGLSSRYSRAFWCHAIPEDPDPGTIWLPGAADG